MASDNNNLIAYQGQPGANSDMACREVHPEMEPLPCPSFEDVFATVRDGKARLAMIPIDNSTAGRVADIHHLLPESELHIIAEHFHPVHHHLLGIKGATLDELKIVRSHEQALSQCRETIRSLDLTPEVHADTAGSAKDLAANPNVNEAAIASSLAAEIYDLDILRENMEDHTHNTTRFIIMAKEPVDPDPDNGPIMTSFVFQVRNVPAALYKAMGGFATNNVNMTKLESYMVNGEFSATQFYADIEGHPSHTNVRLALEELGFFSRAVKVLGVYPANRSGYEN
ncbi:MAG: prephenate dehydratase [Alphaproteobacteria bacterium]|nr:prephenate dehydratase [Alphaproteobacteria bacterium]